eukprot:TRINITY_DN2043_c0_g1_i1.p1 TRINITY_DN2043_c0_g1~~TRINITY_DN2043_c0_g1_i1.p1  ORF type:complete len:142 (-),score=26.61 TRINITY_DN2043_c0_g1_i1:147-572(-)
MNNRRSLLICVLRNNTRAEMLEVLLNDSASSDRYLFSPIPEENNTILHLAAKGSKPEKCKIILKEAPLKFHLVRNVNGQMAVDLAAEKSMISVFCEHQVMMDFASFMFIVNDSSVEAHGIYWNPDEIWKYIMMNWLYLPLQ